MVDFDFINESYQHLLNGKAKKVSPYFVPRVLGNMVAAIIAIKFGFQGPNHSASTGMLLCPDASLLWFCFGHKLTLSRATIDIKLT